MKYKTGDRVRILIGHPMWRLEKIVDGKVVKLDKVEEIDLGPEFVGKLATVVYGVVTQGQESYSLDIDDHGRVSWFELYQIEDVYEDFEEMKRILKRNKPDGKEPKLYIKRKEEGL